MAKFCTNCGNELDENADVCVKCGVYVKKSGAGNTDSVEKSANNGFVLGLVSIVACIIPLFGYPVTICGIIFSSKGMKSNTNKTKAIVGLVLSIIFLVVTLINSAVGVLINLGEL